MKKDNIIQIIFGLLIGLLPWIIIDKMAKDPSMNSPFDPEGIMVLIFFVEVTVFFIWICWFFYSLFLYKNNRVSITLIGIINLPYIVFYGFGNVSIINLPLRIFINKITVRNPPFEELLLIFINIISWIFLLYVIHRRRMKKFPKVTN